MKLKFIYLWIPISISWLFIDFIAGVVISLATIIILHQDNQLDIKNKKVK